MNIGYEYVFSSPSLWVASQGFGLLSRRQFPPMEGASGRRQLPLAEQICGIQPHVAYSHY